MAAPVARGRLRALLPSLASPALRLATLRSAHGGPPHSADHAGKDGGAAGYKGRKGNNDQRSSNSRGHNHSHKHSHKHSHSHKFSGRPTSSSSSSSSSNPRQKRKGGPSAPSSAPAARAPPARERAALKRPVLPLVDAGGPPGLLLWLRGQEQRETDFVNAFPDAYNGAAQWRLLCVSRMTAKGRKADLLTAADVASLASELERASQRRLRVPPVVLERLTWVDEAAGLRHATLFFHEPLTSFDVFEGSGTRAGENALSRSGGGGGGVSGDNDLTMGDGQLMTVPWHRLSIDADGPGAAAQADEGEARHGQSPPSTAPVQHTPLQHANAPSGAAAREQRQKKPERIARERAVAALNHLEDTDAGQLALTPRLSQALFRQAGMFGLRFQSRKTPSLSLASLPAWELAAAQCEDSGQVFYRPSPGSRWLDHDRDVAETFAALEARRA